MTMTRCGYCVTTVQIKISIATARKDPDTFAALRNNGHLFVGRELEPLLSLDRLLQFVDGVHKITFTTKTLRHKAINSDGSSHHRSCLCVLVSLWLIIFPQGFEPVSISPVVSSNPNIRFMFWTAWPAAPLTRLSMAVKTTSWRPRAAKPMSQKFVVLTQLMSGLPSTSRTKNESR